MEPTFTPAQNLPPTYKNYYQVLQDEQTKACCMMKSTGRKILAIFIGMLVICKYFFLIFKKKSVKKILKIFCFSQ